MATIRRDSRERDETRRPRPPAAEFVTRPMTADDLDAVVRLERRCFSDAWTRESFEAELADAPHIRWPLVAVREGGLAGYVIAWFIEDEAHVANLVVAPEWRRRGLGTHLMKLALAEAHRRGARWISLEVRASNQEATALYRKLGFRPAGLRRGYYTDTREDALIMTLVFPDGSSGPDPVI